MTGCDTIDESCELSPAVAPIPAAASASISASPAIPTPLPVPSPQQLAWQERELLLFVHFGMNTFTGKEWGDGRESPRRFLPLGLRPQQWVEVAQAAGFEGLIFTPKHHDGFSLWPSAYTDHTVAHSRWQNGEGDVVREVTDACRAAGLPCGLYFPRWDRHEPTWGTPAYDDFVAYQLTELLTGYGPLLEIWFDGAHGENLAVPSYDLTRYWNTIRWIQPEVVIANAGPDVRWIGNEKGLARETQWSEHDGRWHPAECNVSNRPGWFWRSREDRRVKSVNALLEIYFMSVGRNCTLLLNVPANAYGVLPERDVRHLLSFRAALDHLFANNLIFGRSVSASSFRQNDPGWRPEHIVDEHPGTFWTTDDSVTTGWVEIAPGPIRFNTIEMEEAIAYGQRVEAYRIDAWTGTRWETVSRGTTIGQKKLDRTQMVTTDKVRLVIEKARANPAIRHFGLYDGSCSP